jgi:hypothetical protein
VWAGSITTHLVLSPLTTHRRQLCHAVIMLPWDVQCVCWRGLVGQGSGEGLAMVLLRAHPGMQAVPQTVTAVKHLHCTSSAASPAQEVLGVGQATCSVAGFLGSSQRHTQGMCEAGPSQLPALPERTLTHDESWPRGSWKTGIRLAAGCHQQPFLHVLACLCGANRCANRHGVCPCMQSAQEGGSISPTVPGASALPWPRAGTIHLGWLCAHSWSLSTVGHASAIRHVIT